MKAKQIINYVTVVVILFTTLSGAYAQTRISSPYSRFGVGDLHRFNHPRVMAMGGASVALNSPFMVNFNNPASYHAIEPKSFVFEASAYSKLSSLKTETLSQSSSYTTLGHLLLAFPVTGFWKSSLGLLPYSDVGYKIIDQTIDEDFGKMQHSFEGSGGIHQFYWGNSIGIGSRFSAGFNLVYLFGTLEKNRSLSFPDSAMMMSTRILNTTKVSDLKIKTGVQYHQPLTNDYKLTIGLTYSPEFNIKVRDQVLAYNYFVGSSGIDNVRDTLINTPDVKGNMVLPSDFGAGIMLSKSDRWMLAADYTWQNWENYSLFDINDSLKNSMGISVGMQFRPESTTLSPYWKKMSYRFGIRYNQTYLELYDNQLSEFGISFGVALPLTRTRSTLNLGMELGKRGTTSNNLIQDSFFRFSLGFSVFERWFEQRRYY